MQGKKELFYMNKNKINNSSDMFIYKAYIDFNSAKYLLEAFNNNQIDIDLEKIYFELQQSAEKSFKSLLSHYKIACPKIHDIEELIELCKENNIDLPINIEFLERLTDYAVEGRYGIIHDDLNDTDQYIKIIDKLLLHVTHTIQKGTS